MGTFSVTHLIIILVIVLVIFGPGKLPELGKSLGKAMNGFKSAINENETEKPADSSSDKKSIEG